MTSPRVSTRWIRAMGLALLVLPAPALGAKLVPLDLEGGGLVIAGEVAANQTTLAGIVRVVAEGTEEPIPLRLEARELVGETSLGEQRRLPASALSIPQGVKVGTDAPTDVRITVSGLREAGRFGADIALVPDGKVAANPIVIHLRVIAQTRPAGTTAPATISLRVAKCWGIGCWLTRTFAGTIGPDEDWPVEIHGTGDDAGQIESVQLWLAGERSGRPAVAAIVAKPGPAAKDGGEPVPKPGADGAPRVDAAGLAPNVAPAGWNACGTAPGKMRSAFGTICPGAATQVFLHADPAALRPDRYSGEMVVTLRGAPPSSLRSTFTARTEVSVRDGPGLPALLVVLGIALGRVARGVETPAAQAQIRLLRAWRRARNAASQIREERTKVALLLQLGRAEAAIERGDPEAPLQTEISALARRADVWIAVELWRSRLSDAQWSNLAPEVDAVRVHVANGSVADAEAAFNALEKKILEQVRAPRASASGAPPASLLPPVAAPVEPLEKGYRVADWIAGALSGNGAPSASRVEVLAKLMFFAFLFVLALIGVQTLYFTQPTFGANGFVDYLGLVLWGISADIANRTIQSLPPLKAG